MHKFFIIFFVLYLIYLQPNCYKQYGLQYLFMKKTFTIFILLLIILTSCTKTHKTNVFSTKFEKTRHFLTNKVDSALYLLLNIKDSINTYYKDPYLINEYHILYAEAQFKNQIKQENNYEVAQATKFYDSLFNIYKKDKNLSFQTARAHYYKAVGESEKDHIVESCEDYLTSLKIMKNRFNAKDLNYEKNRFIALIYTRLGTLYSNEYYFDIALDYYHNSYFFFKYIGDTTSYLYSSARIGKSYQSINEMENAKFWYKNTISEASEKNYVYSDYAKRGLAQIYFDDGDIDTSINIVKNLINVSDENEKYAYEHTMAGMYLELNQLDSALHYAKQSFLHGNKSTKLISAKMIYEIYKTMAESSFDESYFMDNKVQPKGRDNTEIKIQIASLYNEYKSEATKTKKYITAIFSIVIILVIITIIFISAMSKTKKNHQKTLDKKNEIIKDNEWKLSLIEGKIKSSNEELRQKEEIIKNQKSEIANIKSKIDNLNKASLEAYYNSDICIEIFKRIKELDTHNLKSSELSTLNGNELVLLLHSADTNLNNFIGRLSNKYPDLKKDDFYCICLLLLNIDKSFLQYLLGKNQSSIWRRLDKVCKIMNIEMNESLIISLIKEI